MRTIDPKDFIKAYLILIIIDMIWLSIIGKYYSNMVEQIQHKKISIRFESALLVYVFLSFMLLQVNDYKEAFLFGLCIYGVVDFTNFAIFEKYSPQAAVIDTLWGGVLFAVSKYIFDRL
jgi:uncharacterized membrane protein